MFSRKIRNIFRKAPFFLVVAAVLATIWYLAWQNHNHFENAMVRQAQNQLTIIARSEAQSIEKYIGDVDGELSELCSDPRLLNAMADRGGTEKKNTDLLGNSFKEIERLADSLSLTDDKGVIVDLVPFNASYIGMDLSKAPDISLMLAGHKTFTSGVFESVSGRKVISNLHPVFDGKKFVGIVRALVLVERINRLIEHINSREKVSAVVIDDDSNILSSSDKENIGKNAIDLLGKNPSHPEFLKMKEIINQMNGGRSGTAVIKYLLDQGNSNSADMLVSYTPIRVGSEIWSIAVAMDYSSIIGPINRNARDNLVSGIFVVIVLTIALVIFYRSEKKNTELSVSKTCVDLINKQLHLEIEERKKIENKLKESLRNRGE